MRPIEFEGQSGVLAKHQPQYQPLPVHVSLGPDCTVTSCWQLDAVELEQLHANGGRLWIRQLTFGQRFQPQLPSIEKPQLL
jgi:hypothetical protein